MQKRKDKTNDRQTKDPICRSFRQDFRVNPIDAALKVAGRHAHASLQQRGAAAACRRPAVFNGPPALQAVWLSCRPSSAGACSTAGCAAARPTTRPPTSHDGGAERAALSTWRSASMLMKHNRQAQDEASWQTYERRGAARTQRTQALVTFRPPDHRGP
jgi:hypothetical protein